MITVSFPGIGIDPFQLSRAAFTIFGREIRWYALIITCGIILAFFYALYRSKQEGITQDDLLDMAIFAIPCAIIGARAYYVLTSLEEFETFGEMIAIWNGGIAIYGAIIAGAITICVVCKVKKIKIMKAFDMASPAVMIGQILGRWGNFFNGEAYGAEVLESSPLYFIRMGLTPNIKSYSVMHYFHPTFLYESVWNLVGFIIINALYKKKKFDGQVFLMYITWYGFGRMLIEGLRTDSLYVGVFRISQVVGFVCFVVGSILLIYNLAKARRAAITAGEYDAAYPKLSHKIGVTLESAQEIAEEEKEESADVSEAYEKRLSDLMGNPESKQNDTNDTNNTNDTKEK